MLAQAFLRRLVFFCAFLPFSVLKSAPVILLRGAATLASFFCFGLYLLNGITSFSFS
jgi:hypothetical protein